MVVLDENRVFQTALANNMADLVSRDRNHPAVIFWSFCNEPCEPASAATASPPLTVSRWCFLNRGCNNQDRSAPTQPSLSFKDAVEANDGTRAVTGNMCVNWGPCPLEQQYLDKQPNSTFQMPQILDVQGFSHVNGGIFKDYHAAWPSRPLVASECCSCLTQ